MITADGEKLISGSQDSTIKLWNLHTGELRCTLKGHSMAVVSLAIYPNGKTLASSSRDGVIQLWNLATGEIVQTLNGYSPVAFSPDGKTLLSGGKDGAIKIWRQIADNDHWIPPLSRQWWEVLGVDEDADLESVKSAYLRLAKLYHPDINSSPDAKTLMQAINYAYQQFQTQTKNPSLR